MMRALILLPLLAGCATKEPTQISIMVPVPCITEQVAEPIYPAVDKEAGIFERVKVLLAERELRIGYETKLTAMLAGCGEVK